MMAQTLPPHKSLPPRGRPRLSLALLGYAAADILGLVLISLGGTWFISGRPMLISSFPTTTIEALLCIGAGFVVMLWAVARLMVTMATQGMGRRGLPAEAANDDDGATEIK